jgi:hypothetical protein
VQHAVIKYQAFGPPVIFSLARKPDKLMGKKPQYTPPVYRAHILEPVECVFPGLNIVTQLAVEQSIDTAMTYKRQGQQYAKKGRKAITLSLDPGKTLVYFRKLKTCQRT